MKSAEAYLPLLSYQHVNNNNPSTNDFNENVELSKSLEYLKNGDINKKQSPKRIQRLACWSFISPSRFSRKHVSLILIILCVSYFFLANYLGFSHFLPKKLLPKQIWKFTATEISCHFPALDPYDPSIKNYTNISHEYKELRCDQGRDGYESMFTSDLHGNLIRLKDPKVFGFVKCCWRVFYRRAQDDFKIDTASTCTNITDKNTKIPDDVEFIAVKCSKSTNDVASGKVVGVFGFTPLKPVKDQPKFEEPRERRRVNVVALGLDAVSHMNFIRNFNSTYQYLINNLDAIEMWGYTKNADNTFPNMLPVYTGLTEAELKKRNWTRFKVLDDAPFIWKKFSAEGYRTAFGEDAVQVGTFLHEKKGFSNPPTDYYHHPYTRYFQSVLGHAVNKGVAQMCYGNRLAFDVLLEMMKKLAVTMDKTRRYFHFTWTTSLTHDYLNYARNGDPYLKDTLEWFHTQGYLEDTVLILMSDHGIRAGPIRSTLQGKIEERMPFLYFVVPPWFREKYPDAIENLRANERRLTSHFDLHETLMDLLYLEKLENYNILERQQELNGAKSLPRGISLFLTVPAKRSCLDASIPNHWCVCRGLKPVKLEGNEIVVEAGKQVVLTINKILASSPECSPLAYESTLNAQAYQSEDVKFEDVSTSILKLSDKRLTAQTVTYNLVVRVEPSGGTFEATVTHVADGRWDVSREISRTNLYGNQSHCIHDYNLKKYCYCAD